MEWEMAISRGRHEFNFSISTSYIGLGFRFNVGDFVDTLEINIICFHAFYFKSGRDK